MTNRMDFSVTPGAVTCANTWPSRESGSTGSILADHGTRRSASLVTLRQMMALDKMAAEHGFSSGSALLCDVASCTLAEIGRKSRPVVQMFVDQAFERYGYRG